MRALLVVLALAGTAHAEPVREEVVGTQLLSVVGRGVSGTYERRITGPWSVVALGGLRAAAVVDFSSRTALLGGELRFWIRPCSPMTGPFVALHVSAGYTRLSDDEMGFVGSSIALSERTDLGWRFVIKNRVSIAPTVGIGFREDVDTSGGLATIVRWQIGLGIELGWMF